jgi:hypothetical protein
MGGCMMERPGDECNGRERRPAEVSSPAPPVAVLFPYPGGGVAE